MLKTTAKNGRRCRRRLPFGHTIQQRQQKSDKIQSICQSDNDDVLAVCSRLAVRLRLCAANALCDSKQIKIDAKNTVQPCW